MTAYHMCKLFFTALMLFGIAIRINCEGSGCLAHNFVAEQTAPLLKDEPELHKIITENWNEYLVGSDYPDTGFILGNTYGEITHWQPFANAYINYLHMMYPTPSLKRDRLLAFLMGIGTHNQSDITVHWTYYNLVAKYDFDNQPDPGTAWQTAHQYMDPASDFDTIVNKHIYNHPVFWWVPVYDLVTVYEFMGYLVPAEEIIKSNAIYYVALGLDENLVALPAYLYDKYVAVPWGMEHIDSPDTEILRYGAFPGQIADSASYLRCLWQFYLGKRMTGDGCFVPPGQRVQGISKTHSLTPFFEFAKMAIEKGWITVNPKVEPDGSVTFTPDSIATTAIFEIEKTLFLNHLILSSEMRKEFL